MASIVVGVDGSPSSLSALRWAARQARLTGAPLRVVHAYHAGDRGGRRVVGSGVGTGASAATLARQAANELLDEVCAQAADALEGVDVTTEPREGGATAALLAAAADADLLVVGSRGRGGFADLLLGSVSHQCASHAPCPVVIVRADQA
ncbi:MAG TPA: universal stress protein [Egibacteraceae bacterium]